jgi:hypothetical protein
MILYLSLQRGSSSRMAAIVTNAKDARIFFFAESNFEGENGIHGVAFADSIQQLGICEEKAVGLCTEDLEIAILLERESGENQFAQLDQGIFTSEGGRMKCQLFDVLVEFDLDLDVGEDYNVFIRLKDEIPFLRKSVWFWK